MVNIFSAKISLFRCFPLGVVLTPGRLFFCLNHLRGEKLNYKSVAKEISKPPLFFGSWSPVGIKVYRVCSIQISFKCFEPCPYLVCHMATIENVYNSILKIYNFRNIVHFLKRILQIMPCFGKMHCYISKTIHSVWVFRHFLLWPRDIPNMGMVQNI